MHIEFLEFVFLLARAQEAAAGRSESASTQQDYAGEKACSKRARSRALFSSASLNASTFCGLEANSGR